MNRCWIHTLVFRGGCDGCEAWAQLQMLLHGQVFFRSTSLGLLPLEAEEHRDEAVGRSVPRKSCQHRSKRSDG